jgi:HEAT repeat protein
MAGLDAATLQHALTDADVGVRRRAAELAGTNPEVDLIPMLADPDSSVVEAAAWACGEQGQAASVAALGDLAGTHDDPLCREAAVASLGAIGDFAGLPAILAALDDRATVRRRAVIALAPFNGETVDVALQTALEDRDWQVRQAAEELSEYRSP